VTVFLSGGFASKYLHGGGNFSVPLQWMLGLRRLKLDAFWLEHLPSEGNMRDDERKIDNFRRQLCAHGLAVHKYPGHNVDSAASSFLKEGGSEEEAPQYVSGRLVIGYLCLENVSAISYCNRRLYQI
jgi:hypothetical protein